jgi:Fic family protein
LERNLWPNKSKGDISETYGVAEAVKFIRETKEHISLDLIKKLHLLVFRNSKPFAGKFRGKGVEVVVADRWGNIVHRGAPQKKIPSLLRELIIWHEKNKKKYHPIVLAAIVHNQFENIHPFQDGNGRVGRLLLNYVLLRHGMLPVNIELKNRQEYYSALQAYQNKGDVRPTIKLIIKEYKRLRKSLKGM